MRKLMTLVAAAALVAVAQPADVLAQGRGNGAAKKNANAQAARVNDRWEDRDVRREDPRDRNGDGRDDRWEDPRDRNDRDDDDRWYDGRGRDEDYRSINQKNGKGPAFCRSGAGHPVHGRQWCVNKGFGLGGNSRWDRVRWEDVIFRRPQQRTNAQMGRDVLSDVLGGVIFGRLDARRRALGVNEPLNGRWVNDGNRSVLLVNAGRYPLAELIDGNRDRRVDVVLLNFGR